MTMQLVMGEAKSALPDDRYFATWVSVEPEPAKEYQGKMMDPGLRWSFTITSGPYAGQKAQRITGDKPTPANACGKMIAGLLGFSPKPGDPINLEPCKGRAYLIGVAKGRIDTVIMPPAVPAPVTLAAPAVPQQ